MFVDILLRVGLFIVSGAVCGALWMVGWFIASKFDSDPTSGGGYFAMGFLTLLFPIIGGGLLSFLIR